MMNEIRAFEKEKKVKTEGVSAKVVNSSLGSSATALLHHLKHRSRVYVGLFIIFGLGLLASLFLTFTSSAVFGINGVIFFVIAGMFVFRMYLADTDLIRHFRATEIGTVSNDLTNTLRGLCESERVEIDKFIEQTSILVGSKSIMFNKTSGIRADFMKLPSREAIAKEKEPKYLLNFLDRLNAFKGELLGHFSERSTASQNHTKRTEEEKKNLHSTIDELRAQISNLETSVDHSKSEEKKQSKLLKVELAQKFELQQKVAELTDSLENQKESSGKQDERLRALRTRFDQEKSDHAKTREDALSNSSYIELVQHLVRLLRSDESEAIELSEHDKEIVATMYATLHELHPDMKRIKELSLIPDETLRARQVQTIIDYYSALIVSADKDEDLPEDEREDKINAYRMARESELQTFHGAS